MWDRRLSPEAATRPGLRDHLYTAVNASRDVAPDEAGSPIIPARDSVGSMETTYEAATASGAIPH